MPQVGAIKATRLQPRAMLRNPRAPASTREDRRLRPTASIAGRGACGHGPATVVPLHRKDHRAGGETVSIPTCGEVPQSTAAEAASLRITLAGPSQARSGDLYETRMVFEAQGASSVDLVTSMPRLVIIKEGM